MIRSAGLFVRLVGATPPAVLLEFEPLSCVRLALRRHIVATLALLTRQRDRRSLV